MENAIRKKLFIICLPIVIVFFIIGSYLFFFDKDECITIKQAYKIAYESVKSENSQVLLYSITSADSTSNEKTDIGTNGRRRFWNLDFAVPNTDTHYVIEVRNGVITSTVQSIGFVKKRNELITSSELIIDSNQALKLAKQKYDLRPGEIWAIGYHFTVSKEAGVVTLVVTGRDQSNNLAQIYIDDSNKNIIKAMHKLNIGGGLYYGNDSKIIINNYDITGICQNYNSMEYFVWGRKIINIIEVKPILLYKKNNNKWLEINMENDILGAWISDDNDSVIYINSNNHIYEYDLITKLFTSLLRADDTIIDTIYSKGKFFVLTKKYLLYSDDSGQAWKKIMLPNKKDISFLNISLDEGEENNPLYLNMDNEILLLEKFNWTKILSIKNNIYDFDVYKNKFAYTTGDKLTIYDINNKAVEFNSSYNNCMIIRVKANVKFDGFFAINNYGDLSKISKEGEDNEWLLTNEITDDKNGFVTDLLYKDGKTWYYSTVSNSVWTSY